jgi:hypothetical protein
MFAGGRKGEMKDRGESECVIRSETSREELEVN